MSGSLRPKSHKVLKALMLVPYHSKMIALAMWLMVRLSEVVLSSTYRKDKIHPKDSGIAGTIPCRHLDIRSYIYPDPQKVVDDINKHWVYDKKRPELKVAILHDTGQGIHIHLQTHDRTEYKE